MPDDHLPDRLSPIDSPERQQLRRDVAAAWADFIATGRHVSGSDADDWLRRLADGEDAPIPQCRT